MRSADGALLALETKSYCTRRKHEANGNGIDGVVQMVHCMH